MGALVPLLMQGFAFFAPIVRDAIAKHQAANQGAMPTDAQMKAIFAANLQAFIAGDEAWLASKGVAPKG